MRLLTALCTVLLLSAFAAAQATIISGTASNWAPAYGVYAAPYVPLVVTPSLTLSIVSPSAVGASDATFGNVAGATNATLSPEFVSSEPPIGVYTQPVWYGPAPESEAPAATVSESRHMLKNQGLDFGIASWSGNQGAAQLVASASRSGKASRTYTNQDIDQVNQKTGTVTYGGKTEKF
jgi:hypothetical protein